MSTPENCYILPRLKKDKCLIRYIKNKACSSALVKIGKKKGNIQHFLGSTKIQVFAMHHKATKRQTSAKVIKCSLFGAFVSGVRCKKEKKRVRSSLLCFKIEFSNTE